MTCKKSTDLSPCLTIPTPVWCYTTTFLTDECIALTRRWTVSRHIVSSANFNAIRSRRQYLYSSENSNSQCVLCCCCCCCCVHFVRVINRQTNEPPNNEFKFTEWKCDVIYAWFSLQFSTFILIHVLGLSLSFFCCCPSLLSNIQIGIWVVIYDRHCDWIVWLQEHIYPTSSICDAVYFNEIISQSIWWVGARRKMSYVK